MKNGMKSSLAVKSVLDSLQNFAEKKIDIKMTASKCHASW